MKKKEVIRPLFVNTDVSISELKPSETTFIRGMTFDISANPVSNIGTNNPSGEGQNQLVQTTGRSNVAVPDTLLPQGFNKNIGSFDSPITQECFYFNYNINGNHGIYSIDGNTGQWSKVIEDSNLLFTDSQENYIKDHRVLLRIVKDKSGNIIEKYLLITEGGSWQKYISVIAATSTNGFDSSAYPYWQLHQPHFDRRELVEWAMRPPMVKPLVTILSNTSSDIGKINRFIDNGIQVAIAYQNTDGRTSTLSPYSLPILIKSEDYLNNPDDIPKNVSLELYAGSCLTEKILVYVRTSNTLPTDLAKISPYGDWYLYDTIKKFPDSNSGNVIGSKYWLRQNPFANNNYDNIFNTIEYKFDLSKVQQIVNQEDADMIQTGMPQISVALTDLQDAALLCDNRYGYPNFSNDVIDKFTITVEEKENKSCPVASRNIRLYAIAASPFDTNQWASQVGYYNTDDKAMLFGGLKIGGSNMVDIDINVSAAFNLNFGDKNAFRGYLKGTPYYADGTWYHVNSDNSLVKIENLLDIREASVKEFIQNVYVSGGYFVCVFDITAPAGRYVATLGRHDVGSVGDYRNTSTYIYGIANSRVKSVTGIAGAASTMTSIKPNAINNKNGILYSKEMEIDCTTGDVDVWGNGADLFYVYCPYLTSNHAYRFFEGYWKEDTPPINGTSLSVELFPYRVNGNATNDCGQFTDKNGFYWAYTNDLTAAVRDIQIVAKVNCVYPTIYNIPTSTSGSGWKKNTDNYLASYNEGNVGAANRILYSGKVVSLDGTVSYSNIAISIKDGSTVYTRSDGTFTLIVHNGMSTLRQSNVYVNAGGSFLVTIADCGQLPLENFSESLVPCIGNSIRNYPVPLNLFVQVSTESQESLKESGANLVGVYGADLAGRLMFVNVINTSIIPSFQQRGNTNATYLQAAIASTLDLSSYSDMAYLIFCVSKNIAIKRFIQWVGDEIDYVDNGGNIVSDPSSAVFCQIKINSLFNANVANNFSLLSTYQFVPNDRLRILDDGNGNLYNSDNPIDIQILGTNYQQAAIQEGLLPPQANTVLSTKATSPDVILIVRYDSRLDALIHSTGFWIEIYTPTQQTDIVPFYEDKIYPIINGQPSEFKGYTNGVPQYNYINTVIFDFWDTYFFQRNITIPKIGNKFFSHPFESLNVTDNWGANITSGGRNNIKNDNATQYWLGGEARKSDDFLNNGIVNGLATFRETNKKNYGINPYGAIIAAYSAKNIILLVCENDWYSIDYNFHRAYLDENGALVANLSNGLSEIYQRTGDVFGMDKNDTATFNFFDKEAFWYDRKVGGLVRCNFRTASDVSIKSEGELGGMQSYMNEKTEFVTNWNYNKPNKNLFDIVSGIDKELGKFYITFRCRRNNSTDVNSFINDRRDWQLNFQETIVYDMVNHGWLRSEGFTPEGYGTIKGNANGNQMITFASGKPYYQNSVKDSFNEYFGVQTQPVMHLVFNQSKDVVSVFEGMVLEANPSGWFADKIYTDFKNSFSYLSQNQFYPFYNNYYAAFLRNMNSYPSMSPDQTFSSMLFDGYRNVGKYMVIRLVGNYDSLGEYKEINEISCLISVEDSNVNK
jgi:hypothetical protein